jgi:hypothetical protein
MELRAFPTHIGKYSPTELHPSPWVFKTGFPNIAQSGLGLTVYSRLPWNSKSSYFSLPSAGITGLYHHAQLNETFL